MENLIEIIAFLIFIALTGMSAASKKAREKQKEYKSESESESDIFAPSEPATPPMNERTNWRTYQNPSEARNMPAPSKSMSSSQSKPSQRTGPESEPIPPNSPQEPIWSKMLREMLDMNESTPEPVFESAPPEKRTKKLTRKTRETKTPKGVETRPPAPPRTFTTPRTYTEKPSLPSPLANIYARVQTEPLQAAILLSEIIQAPRSKRRSIRSFS